MIVNLVSLVYRSLQPNKYFISYSSASNQLLFFLMKMLQTLLSHMLCSVYVMFSGAIVWIEIFLCGVKDIFVHFAIAT
uniref:Uncharacterized protein n=1 Tax=Seriola dumerili TaxID=41447 RepID=A0A3B4V5M2_SERDU